MKAKEIEIIEAHIWTAFFFTMPLEASVKGTQIALDGNFSIDGGEFGRQIRLVEIVGIYHMRRLYWNQSGYNLMIFQNVIFKKGKVPRLKVRGALGPMRIAIAPAPPVGLAGQGG